jgi:hypothetical protein
MAGCLGPNLGPGSILAFPARSAGAGFCFVEWGPPVLVRLLAFSDARTQILSMTQDTNIGPGKRYAFPDLDKRLDADHRDASTNWKDMVLRYPATADGAGYYGYGR